MRPKKTSLTDRRYVLPFILVTSLFFLWGFARAILDVLNRHFQDFLSISITQSTLIQVTTYLGYFIMALPAGWVTERYGYRRGVVTGLLLYAVGAFLFVPAMGVGTFPAFLLALFVIGCGLTFLEVSANPYVTLLGPASTSSSRLNLAQSFNGMGCALAPLLVGQFLFSDKDADVSVPYVIMGVFVVIVAVTFSYVQLPDVVRGNGMAQTGEEKATFMALLRKPVLLYGLLALLAYEVSEISINSYFMNLTTGLGWLTDIAASHMLAIALLLFMAGRFLGSWVMRYVAAERVLLVSGLGTMACMVIVLCNMQVVSLVALILNYVFEAIMFPTIYSLSLQELSPGETKRAGSLLMMTPVGGCAFLLMGVIADRTSLVIPLVLPLAGFVGVTLYASWLCRRCR